ncbi:MAG: hypothetical protein P8M30_10550 [Planctomycetaceae bacterium]|nr:hypothetical protein [bacterium]MDC0273807.1 hypothetical protein [Planctomycetaceae bacterium]MDG2389746.1 hypothetical protein [Planctomycetaceae bacterium]
MFSLCVLTQSFVLGCGSTADTPELSSVTGSVMVDGEPVTEGQITLIPNTESGPQGPSFAGQIREDGSFSICGPNGVEGAMPGEYQVVIYAIPATHEELINAAQNGRLKRSDFVHDSLIPPAYQNQKSTPLKILVKAEQENQYQFELKHQPGIKISRSIQ